MSIQDTLFFQRAITYQDGQARTKRAAMKTGLVGIVIGVVVAAGSYLGQWIILGHSAFEAVANQYPAPRADLIVAGAFYFGIAIAVVGLIMAVVSFLRPTKEVACPRCDTRHRIYQRVRKYMCINCGELLLLGSEPSEAPEFSPCPYCDLPTAVARSHGRFRCPNCGVVRLPGEDQFTGSVVNCPTCGDPVPKAAIYCIKCESILRADFSPSPEEQPGLAFDEDWKIGQDAKGHFFFGKALLERIQSKTESVATLADVSNLLLTLTEALVSFEVAIVRDSAVKQAVESTLAELDLTYASLLSRERQLLSKPAPGTVLTTLSTEPHMRPRRRLESLIGPQSLTSLGSIGTWGDRLIELDGSGKDARLRSYERLKQETDRFSVWRVGQEAPQSTA